MVFLTCWVKIKRMNPRSLVVLLVGLFAVIGSGAVFLATTKNASFEAKAPAGAVTVVKIGNRTIPVELAQTFEERSQGLSDRPTLEGGTGLLFVFDEIRPVSFWMRNMHFDLDIIWIRHGKIVGIERNVPAPDPGIDPGDLPLYESGEAVSHVLELNAGEAAGLNVGDSVEVSTINAV
ncbi:MAG: DUF192 domain-containing protein [Patescibacteria group bacterium]